MDSYEILWDSRALKELEKLPQKEITGILHKVNELSANPYFGKPLKGQFSGYYRLRHGIYRVIYSIKHRVLQIHIFRVGKRSDVYRLK